MSPKSCVHCGKDTGEGELYCPGCLAASAVARKKGLWIFAIVFSALLLFLTGLVLWHGGFGWASLSLDSIWRRPAAVINGESISRADLNARVRTLRGIVERQHGKDIFAGERGGALLSSLTEEALKGLLTEKLLAQEARREGIQITARQVEQRMDRVARENFGSREGLEAKLREEGMSAEDLRDHLRSLLVLDALKKAKTPGGADPEAGFNAWLVQARRKANLVIYDSSLGGASGSTGGRCCSLKAGPGNSGAPNGPSFPAESGIGEEAGKACLETYKKTHPEEKGLTARVRDYGCHVRVDIQKEGKVVKSYTYKQGRVWEIS